MIPDTGMQRSLFPLVPHDKTHHKVVDCVDSGVRDGVVARNVVAHVLGAQQARLLEGPLAEGHAEVLVARLLESARHGGHTKVDQILIT